MPSSMCCPVGFSRQCMMVSASSSNQLRRSSGDHTPTLLSHPARLVVELTSGLTVTTRLAASGASRVRSSRVRPSAACVVVVASGVRPISAGTAGGAVTGDLVAAQPLRGGIAHRARRGVGLEPGPRRRRVHAERRGEVGELLVAQQRRMILRMALDRQAVTLDRVGDDHRRPAVVDLRVRLPQRVQVVPAQVADRLDQGAIVQFGDQAPDGLAVLAGPRQPVA